MRDILIKTYLDWVNNYVSVDTFAEHNGITKEQAYSLIALSRDVFRSSHPDA